MSKINYFKDCTKDYVRLDIIIKLAILELVALLVFVVLFQALTAPAVALVATQALNSTAGT